MKLRESIQLLEDYKKGNLPAGISDETLWEAQKIKQVHVTYLSFSFRIIIIVLVFFSGIIT